ncbi:HLA class II histocompatibility antigen, DQ beta 1 chain-like [Marmota marmota marmota]|uniref:HLA class II histocompatibility antigen, DQ beta 1 chain-like n=1 Tax=Marmota marmota marmota TaxID=9994 RepID=UPI0020929832|nr:HLA class II histocompatibility antigen, DQ beta 1 chain-like [Marmota marmota marmota]
MVVLMVLRTPMANRRDSPKDFMYQFKGTCYFTNGTQRVRLMARQIYNKEEILSFDSDVGVFVAVTKLRQSSAKSCNAQKDLLAEYQAHVDTLCRHNYYQTAFFTVQLRVEPMVTISPARTEPLNHHNLLICSVTNFYPQQVKVRWFWNKEEETSGVVSTPLIQNGDWTYKILVMLEVTPQPGDVYTCHLEHPSLQSPITVEWWALSESAQNKMLSGIGSFVPGLIFLGLGLVVHFWNKKGLMHLFQHVYSCYPCSMVYCALHTCAQFLASLLSGL